MTASGGTSGPRAVLIGPMAAGKTSVGRELARLWGVDFRDLDREIERRAQRAVPAIFAADGEDAFRELESSVLAELLRSHPGVLSLGGGAPLRPANRDLLTGHTVVLLSIDTAAARRRLRGGAGRPLLAGDDPVGAWTRITDERMPIYRSLATHTIDGGAPAATAVARRIAAELDAAPVPSSEETS